MLDPMTKPDNPRVIVTRRLPAEIDARLADLFDSQLNPNDVPMTRDELKAAIADCDVLVPTVTDQIDREVIEAASPRLKLIANFGAGTDHIDVAAAHARGIIVTNTPGVLTEDTADFTMALILAVPRRLVEGDRLTRAGGFKGWTPTSLLGHRVRGKKLGIVGMGRIGQAVARRASAFGLSVHYHNRRPVSEPIEKELAATYWPDLDAMLAAVDIVSINCPKTPDTFHLINAERLSKMSPSSYIVNTSRGDVIDEAALAAALADGTIGGAGLDVYEQEPKVHSGLMGLQNVILAPHMGSATHESRREMGEKVLINIRAWMDHHKVPDRVLPPGSTFSKAS
ncbi:MAG: D-glycerate dehydrogenase [Hellea sp.]|nr:D-glycerate dehydrogenase [Hellea sp.]